MLKPLEMSANNQDRNHVKCWQFVTKRPYINSFKFRILHKAMQSVDVIESQMNKKKKEYYQLNILEVQEQSILN